MRLGPLLFALWLGSLPVAAHAFMWPNTAEQVERKLTGADVRGRRAAAEQLGELPGGTAQRLTLKALDDSDLEVRLLAARAAAALGIAAASERVVAWLNDPESRVRLAGAELLEQMPLARAVPPLGRLLADPDPNVRAAAAAALGASGSPDATVPLLGHLDDAAPTVRRAVVLALSKLADPRAVLPLIGKIQDQRPPVRRSVARALGDLGDARGTAVLILALRDDDEGVRIAALEALGKIGDVSATLPIVHLLHDDARQSVHVAALEALGRLRSAEALQAVVLALAQPAPLPEVARRVLARDPERTAPALLACLSGQPSQPQAEGCVLALGDIADARSGPAITAALQQGIVSPRVVMSALTSLRDPNTLPTVLEQLGARDDQTRAAAIDAASAILNPEKPDGRAVEPIARVLASSGLTVAERARLVTLLGRSGSPRAASAIVPFARHSDDLTLRVAALEALGLLGPTGHDAVLITALDDQHPEVRASAALALRRAAAGASVRVLLDRLSQRAEQDRVALAHALTGALSRTTHAATIARVARVLDSSRGAERDALIEALGHAPGALGSAPLIALAERSLTVADRAKVAEALVAHPEAAAALRRLAADPDAAVRANAVWALGYAGTAADLRLLHDSSSDRDVAVAANAVAALGRLGMRTKTDVTAGLCKAASQRRGVVRSNAWSALRLLGQRCSGSDEARLLARDDSELARRALGWLMTSVSPPSPERRNAERAALQRCAAEDRSGDVAAACDGRAPAAIAEQSPVLVYVVPAGGAKPVAGAPYTLAFADGTLRLGITDRRGAVFERFAPRGIVSLEQPAPLSD